MVNPTLQHMPALPLPSVYTLKHFKPGDEHTWVRVQQMAEPFIPISFELFKHEFGDDQTVLSQRMLFLCNESGEAIGTGAAWFDDNYHGASYGRIHWVAIIPQYQGRGLALPFVHALCARLQELGHAQAYLQSDASRIRAIKTYGKCGFVPEIKDDQDVLVWQSIKNAN